MKSTSPASRPVRMAATSPLRTSAGPEVMRRFARISAATMPASVVLPRPGGPANSRWSTAWPRRRAASSTMASRSRSSSWPTNSSSRLGRRLASSATSPSASAPERGRSPAPGAGAASAARISRRGLTRAAPREAGERSPVHRQLAQRLAEQLLDRALAGQHAQRRPHLVRSVAELAERLGHLGRRRGRSARSEQLGGAGAVELIEAGLELDEQPRRRLLPHARDEGQRVDVGARHALGQAGRGVDRDDGERERGPDAMRAEEELEALPLLRGGKAVEDDRALADVGVDKEGDLP